MPLPDFLRKKVPKQENIRKLKALLGDQNLCTVCEEAKCPNIGECYAASTCTFMILGNNCTRSCAFCGVSHGKPLLPDPTEPKRIAEAVKKLGLSYVVITSVTRDDLPDGGAEHFSKTIRNLRLNVSVPYVEVLIPDLQGNKETLKIILDAKPYVLNHNIETVPRLYSAVRPQAIYNRSLDLLRQAKELAGGIYTKSGFMVGLGESDEEVVAVLRDLRSVKVDIVTIGQYLPPSRLHPKPERYVLPEVFDKWEKLGQEMGFLAVESGPFVRSSYHAADVLHSKIRD